MWHGASSSQGAIGGVLGGIPDDVDVVLSLSAVIAAYSVLCAKFKPKFAMGHPGPRRRAGLAQAAAIRAKLSPTELPALESGLATPQQSSRGASTWGHKRPRTCLGRGAQKQLSMDQQQLQDAQHQLALDQQQLQGAQHQLAVDKQQLQGAQRQLAVDQQQLQDAKHQLAVDQQQLQDAQHQLAVDQQQLQDAQHQLAVDQQQMQGAQHQLGVDKQQLQGAQHQLAVDQQQLQDAQHQLAVDKQQLQGAQHQLAVDQQQLQDAQHQLAVDKQQLQGAQHQLGVDLEQLQGAQHQLAVDKQQLQGAQHQLAVDQQLLQGAQHQLAVDLEQLQGAQHQLGQALEQLQNGRTGLERSEILLRQHMDACMSYDSCGYEFEPAPQPASSCPSWKHRQETAAKAWIARALHDKQAIIDNAPAAAAAAAEECELLRQLMQARLDAAILSCCSGAQLEELPATVVERVGLAHRFQLTVRVVDNYPVAICTDAMTKLNHHAGCGKASRDIKPRLNSHIDARQQEEGFDWEVERRFKEDQLNLQYSMAGAGADDVHTCASSLSCSRPTASCAKRSCDITGLCGFVCCHGVPALGLFCNMRTPEQFTYYLLGLERLLLRAHNVVHIYVDIACRLKITWDRYVSVHGLDPSWSSVKMMVPMMHAASHDTACQLANNARFLKGTAFRVGEQTEQAWSRLKPLGKTTRYMTLGHRSDVIQSALSAIALEKQSKMVELLDGCHTNMVTKQEEVTKKLGKLREQALAEGVTSGEEASIKYQSQHLLVGARASRVPLAWPAEYVELKLVTSAIRSETGVMSLDLCHDCLPPLLPDMAKLLTRGRTLPQLTGIEYKLLDLELEHGVHNTTGSWLCQSLPGVSVHAHGLQLLKTAKISGLRDQVWHLVMLVAQLETKKDNWGTADKDTRALAKQAKAKMRLARQALDDLALWEVLGTNQVLDQVQVSHSQLRDMVQGGPAPWEEECQSTPLGKELFFGRQFLHLLSDSERCLEQLAVLHLERARLHAWLEHMCGVCQAACTKLEVQPSIATAGKLFYLHQHLAHFKAQILQLHGLQW
ncbi:hypothetical protein QJQ45_013272 [Haematococcus lacustris]|nr:hypothetical protein QJQ45_013272 [Haematococcus lacustris]